MLGAHSGSLLKMLAAQEQVLGASGSQAPVR